MECLDTIKSLKINYKKNVGTVLVVVEGANYEFDLLNMILGHILKYKLVTKSRNQAKYKEYNEYAMKDNDESRFIIINTKNSNIGTIEDDDEYRNSVYKMAYEKYNIDLKNKPVYFIWDRDCKSNNGEIVRTLLGKLKNPYDNDNYENGLLLLSYPAIETYTLSCFEKNRVFLNENIKKYVTKIKKYSLSELDKNKIQRATIEMINRLNELRISYREIYNIGNANIKIFDKEEVIYKNRKSYLLLSLVSYIFWDLGIIEERDSK